MVRRGKALRGKVELSHIDTLNNGSFKYIKWQYAGGISHGLGTQYWTTGALGIYRMVDKYVVLKYVIFPR